MRALVLVVLCGCSVAFMRKPPEQHCTRSKAWVAVDGVGSIGAIAGATALVIAGDQRDGALYPAAALGLAAVSIAYAFSGETGNGWADRCRR